VVKAGLTSESVKSVCKAVRTDVRSVGEGGGGVSGKRDAIGVVEGGRPLVKLCFRDENPLDVDDDNVPWL
jgi:hypothetical protein